MPDQGLTDWLPGLNIPQDNRLVITARSQQLSIWAEGNTCNCIPLPPQELTDTLLGLDIPQSSRTVITAGSQQFSIRAESNTMNHCTDQGTDRLSCLYIPENDGIVKTARSKYSSIWAKGNTGNCVRMRAQALTDWLPGLNIPQDNRLVIAARSQ